jgi:glyoxylase-like metal-dependent hydrolase (beta-lactamase superfamily II)
MNVQHFFEEHSSTLTYIVHDGSAAVVIDPVRHYDPRSGRISWAPSERVARYIDTEKLSVKYVIDTHAHADHMTALPFFCERYGAQTVTGRRIGEVQRRFSELYNLDPGFPVDGSQFDLLADEGDILQVGSLQAEAMHTPGHTPAHMCWRIEDAVFLGDTLFMPDYGTARCDFPGGSAKHLYDSIRRIYALPNETRLFVCHDYRPGGRDLQFETTVGEQKRHNVQLNQHTTKEDYVAFRTERDAGLGVPAVMLAVMQVNIRAGQLPEKESNGIAYLKIPLDTFGKESQ